MARRSEIARTHFARRAGRARERSRSNSAIRAREMRGWGFIGSIVTAARYKRK
jgi:hypothetical protein